MKTKNPIIWKKENCLMGSCQGLNTKHWYSIPFTTPQGLVCECYNCGKTRGVEVEK